MQQDLFSSSEIPTWQSVLTRQIGSLWGLVPCPLPPRNASIIHYESDIYVDGIHTVVTLSCAIILLFCFSGVQRVTMRGTCDTILQILPCFRDLEHGATSNTRFVLYYFLSAGASLVSLLALILDSHEVDKGFRIAIQMCQRIFGGAAAVLLTIALNHQREFRHMDSLHGDIGIVQLVGQIRRINYAVVIIYGIYIITETAVSFVDQSHGLREAMAALSFVVIIVLNLPILAAAIWLVVHKGHVSPTVAARVALILGIVLRFLGSIDPSFWNKLTLEKWIDEDPCPLGGVLAFFNIMRILNCFGQLLLFSFVISEFRRSRSMVTQESSLLASAQYDDFADDQSSNRSEGDLQRSASGF